MASPSHENKAHKEPAQPRLPQAKVERGWRIAPVWIIPVVAIGFVGWLVYTTWIEAGPTITVWFREGQGIQKGQTEVKYRGVQIGQVTGIKLSKDHQWVKVQAQLDNSASGVARQGSQFWIVRPEVSLSGIRGLKTIVSGNYIQVDPGQGPQTNEFVGLEQAPVIELGSEKALRVRLVTAELRAITPGTAVLYRGIQVGETTKNQLGAHAQAVDLQVYIYPQFKNLVRMNSKFWNAGGINLALGLLGVDVTAQSVKTLLAGGLAFATPDPPGEPATDGTAFRLYDKAQPEWLNWAPDIPLPSIRSRTVEEENQ